jgi:hypothetical protein
MFNKKITPSVWQKLYRKLEIKTFIGQCLKKVTFKLKIQIRKKCLQILQF